MPTMGRRPVALCSQTNSSAGSLEGAVGSVV